MSGGEKMMGSCENESNYPTLIVSHFSKLWRKLCQMVWS